ncbi:MAG: NtaA/DmoA family FMN-dependent monooxygenase [Pseudoclavibacter sp.]
MSDDLRRRHLVLTMFMHPAGYHNYSWRGADSRAEEWGGLDLIVDLAAQAEAAKLDAVFFADTVSPGPLLRGDTKVGGYYEPITTMSALASVTEHIGLIGTGSTTFSQPTTLARQFAGLDTLSGGRAGWNIVTSFLGNEQYGLTEMPDAAERYRRAHEFVDVVRRLWTSWEDDAVIADRESAWWVDPAKIHAIDHVGDYYAVTGPLIMRRSPQGGPVLVQAGSSGPGIDLGATHADLIYTAQPMLEGAVDFYATYKDTVEAKGRARDEVAILPGILPIIGRTEAEAQEFLDELTSLVDIEHGRAQFAESLGFELDDIDPDESIPAERFDRGTATTSRYEIFRRRSVEQGYTLRELIVESSRASGHLWAVGSASRIADQMAEWFESRACDGFSLNAPSIPEGYRRICELLVPELQERGLFHGDYEGGTLREQLDAGRRRPVGA